MIITDLWLWNYRKHKKAHFKFKQGVTGIVGPNGVGKSTIIEAIVFLITGELFSGKKDEALSLGEDSGRVAGSFILNEKVARLERHLDMSKVTLTYDGVTYKKATEIKKLWDDLLQLNTEIIKKVIVAQQGHIQQLFSGDTSIREKVFQKIFLVPPTEQLRSMIWKNYLNQAPPVFPTEDLIELKNSLERTEAEVDGLQLNRTRYELMTDNDLEAARRRIDYLKKCIDDRGKRHMLIEARDEASHQVAELGLEGNLIEATLEAIDINKYRRINKALLQYKGLYAQKLKLEAELASLSYPMSEGEYLVIRDKINVCVGDLKNIQEEDSSLRIQLTLVNKELETIEKLHGVGTCPTCKQEVKNLESHITDLKNRRARILKERDEWDHAQFNVEGLIDTFQNSIGEYEQIDMRHKALKKQLEQLGDITYDEQAVKDTAEIIEEYELNKQTLNDIELKLVKAGSTYDRLKAEIDNLAEYDGEEFSPELELDMLACSLNHNTECVRYDQQLNVEIKIKQAEARNLKERIKNTEENSKKNDRRNNYVAALTKAYEVLHTSQFPRKLIMSYADVVTEYLQVNLDMFGFPYKARVADNFEIEMLDSDGRKLPSISGGEEIVVGISLHLALHDLFGQSFPLMIIDEGTTHLDVKNREAYFEMIKSLKGKSTLKQIIIIDHDPQIADVVDDVIELKKDE